MSNYNSYMHCMINEIANKTFMLKKRYTFTYLLIPFKIPFFKGIKVPFFTFERYKGTVATLVYIFNIHVSTKKVI